MVQRYMLEDEANKRKVAPDPKEVDEAYNEMRELNLQFAQQIAAQPFMEAEVQGAYPAANGRRSPAHG